MTRDGANEASIGAGQEPPAKTEGVNDETPADSCTLRRKEQFSYQGLKVAMNEYYSFEMHLSMSLMTCKSWRQAPFRTHAGAFLLIVSNVVTSQAVRAVLVWEKRG